ncbi:hypothetical protein BKP45_10360 [Anaerobacillus alkalidiazotrophicus]|uniref:DUF4260 domain-containing protein n=1 Tax=Anaerobacillus alkalidiazotrophicus TaxID=472963 RepID=A0A1S2M6A9_9BACI|nr:DUF4260 family protein [Anaerobacillus alkalidiazotrophicus]OIJ20174.1 hypothetical protein BKP45_10360 [Anaerobacillus alkalidiazotrophicus]
MSLRKVIYFENVIGFILCLLLYLHLDFSLLLFLLLLLTPDITMIGYLFDKKIGSYVYNAGHSFIIPAVLFIVAFHNEFSTLLMIAIIWAAHIFMDRSLGFGLKYKYNFKETHLQKI